MIQSQLILYYSYTQTKCDYRQGQFETQLNSQLEHQQYFLFSFAVNKQRYRICFSNLSKKSNTNQLGKSTFIRSSSQQQQQ